MAQMSNTSLAHLWVIDRRCRFAKNNNNNNIQSKWKWKWQLQFSYAPVHTSGWYRFCMFDQFDRMMVRKYDFNWKLSELIEAFFVFIDYTILAFYVVFATNERVKCTHFAYGEYNWIHAIEYSNDDDVVVHRLLLCSSTGNEFQYDRTYIWFNFKCICKFAKIVYSASSVKQQWMKEAKIKKSIGESRARFWCDWKIVFN